MDRSRQRVVWVVGVVGLAVLAVWWLAMSPPAEQEPEASAPGGHAGADALVPADPSKPAAPTSPLREAEQKPAEPPSRAEEVMKTPAKQDPQAVHATLPTRQGPVDELSRRFAGESRAASSDSDDARVRAAFTDPAIPPEMLHSVECRRSVCRVELRWTPQHDQAYVLGLTRAVGTFSAPLGIEGAGEPDSAGTRPLVVYFGLAH